MEKSRIYHNLNVANLCAMVIGSYFVYKTQKNELFYPTEREFISLTDLNIITTYLMYKLNLKYYFSEDLMLIFR